MMSAFRTRARLAGTGALLSLLVAGPALADDTEIYRSQAAAIGANPNVLFIIDTSGSMDSEVETPALYDPSQTYGGSCQSSRIYFSTNDDIPSCSTAAWFPASSNACSAASEALRAGGGGVWPAAGTPRAQLAQFRGSPSQWQELSSGNGGTVECYADDGIHGLNAASADRYIQDNGGSGYSATNGNLWSSPALSGKAYRLYSGNYLNFKNANLRVTMTRLQIVRDVAIKLAGSLQGVNLGLMRYSSNAEGGMVIQAVRDIAQNRTSVINTLKAFNPKSGDGFTPLSETLYEAALYLRGDPVDYGNGSSPSRSVDDAREPNNTSRYNSPIDYQCQKNYVVYLTDGLPTQDSSANGELRARRLIGGRCDDPDAPRSAGWEAGDGRCADDLAAYLNNNDLSPLPGKQTAQTYMIGFGSDVQDSVTFLDEVAKAGGTDRAYTAADTETLTQTLQTIFSNIQRKSATFTTPSVSINAFNRAQTINELYFTVFQADQGVHWPGNLKKYRSRGGVIVDANGALAVNANGSFANGTTSIWSPESDGADVTKGGAASRLPAPSARKLYTFFGNKNLKDPGNALVKGNGSLTDQVLGSGTDTASCSARCAETIDWARGIDVTDVDGDGDRTEQIRFLGDPLHGRPGVVSYGGRVNAKDPLDVVVYVPTNDGFLHAIDGKTGQELWAFIPPELLSRLFRLKENDAVAQRSYGLDGDVRVLKFDKNQDGVIEASTGDFVWIFFGMRAGGNHYFALDVTDRDNPRLLWDIGPEQLPGVGQTWSPPAIARVRVGTNDNANDRKFVLIFGGGYDPTQENQPYAVDNIGNRIYMVDAETGALLWYAGGPTLVPPARRPNLALDAMTNSFPAPVTVIDTNGDLFADRIYAGDMGGRLWRFDIFNGKPADSLVTGGVLARLGAGDAGPNPPESSARRFYNAPDVALIQQLDRDPYYNIAIGSGYRGHPLDTMTEEHFYSIRDKRPYAQLSQADYAALRPIQPSDLVDITADPKGTPVTPADAGWMLRVSARSGRAGEKVLSDSTTLNNIVEFTTFQPAPPAAADPCYPTNINRAYALFATTGKPAIDFNGDGKIDNNDVSFTLRQQDGIVGGVKISFDYSGIPDPNATPDPDESPGPNPPPDPPEVPSTVCRAGVESIKCPRGGGVRRTFWERKDAR